ncbi:T9SS type A sorting domain-containing protein [Winogradskyella vidalii]|uniref:T9SS type A sorting domain-containing protein n=1 Tax=Winogradskyella vidalii TaxID=2615024 RepID=UPI0015CB83FE|nr:T9SS type A sorting domain-containing protein [Winogradskyella vidalii]
MMLKTTRALGRFALSLLFTLAIFMSSSTLVMAQTITDAFPKRVTTSSKVTIIGSGFTASNIGDIYIVGINIVRRTLVSSTEVTCVVSRNTGGISGDTNGTLTMSGATYGSGLDRDFEYVGPASKSISENSENRIREVYTTWDHDNDGVGFWASSDFSSNNNMPNDSHELLGFKMKYDGDDIIFSTGIDDTLLEAQLSSLGVDVSETSTEYVGQNFQAYSTNGISGKPNSNNYMGFADKIDGFDGSIVLNNAVRKTVYDVIIDGDKGLEMGTGIANFNNQADIRFYSGNGDVGAVNDGVPDLLITQIAQPGGSDVYYYADVDGNVVGRPIKLSFVNNNATRLYEWKVDFYRLDFSTGSTFETAIPTTESFGNGQTRGYRMAAFNLEDFGIDGTINATIDDIDNINIGAGGSSDMAFMAYNKAAFEIKSPVISKSPVSRFICRLPSVSSLVFSAEGDIEGTPSTDPTEAAAEAITYTWFKNNIELGETSNTLTIPSGLTSSDLTDNNYKVRVANSYGAVDLPFKISEGGTPAYWDGSSWELPSIYDGITINDEDRNLIFSDNYNQSGDLVGCDCTVNAGKVVVIPDGSSMVLFNAITVEPMIAETVEDGVTVDEVPAGSFTLQNNASLVQINAVTNSGEIKVERIADNLNANDYVFWSSPVGDATMSTLPGNLKYEWDTNDINDLGTRGDWSSASGTMSVGRGYIARVPSASDYTALFTGVPNNGNLSWNVYKTGTTTGMVEADTHWNLVGNPYPSALSADKFTEDNTDIDGSIYLWQHHSPASTANTNPFYENFPVNYGDQYLAYNKLGASTPETEFDGFIASGQGFFVKVLESAGANPAITFTNNMRYDDAENGYDNSEFYRSNSDATTETTEKQLIWLSLINENNKASTILVGYAEGATVGKDRLYDAFSNNEGFNLYSLISEAEKLEIQGLPLPFDDTSTVPLGVELAENGIYKIAIGDLEGSLFVDQAQNIYIEDTYSGVIHDLRVSPYTFMGEAGVVNDRFVLRYSESSSLSVAEASANSTFAYIKNSVLNVKSNKGITAVKVYDLNGRNVISYASNGQLQLTENFQFSKGVYLVSITLEGDREFIKKVVN